LAFPYQRKITMAAVPTNPLVGASDAETERRCRLVLDYLLHIERPFSSPELEEAEALMLAAVQNALQAHSLSTSTVNPDSPATS
jgi:hypothetical protein